VLFLRRQTCKYDLGHGYWSNHPLVWTPRSVISLQLTSARVVYGWLRKCIIGVGSSCGSKVSILFVSGTTGLRCGSPIATVGDLESLWLRWWDAAGRRAKSLLFLSPAQQWDKRFRREIVADRLHKNCLLRHSAQLLFCQLFNVHVVPLVELGDDSFLIRFIVINAYPGAFELIAMPNQASRLRSWLPHAQRCSTREGFHCPNPGICQRKATANHSRG